jgi:hypothetical protein
MSLLEFLYTIELKDFLLFYHVSIISQIFNACNNMIKKFNFYFFGFDSIFDGLLKKHVKLDP